MVNKRNGISIACWLTAAMLMAACARTTVKPDAPIRILAKGGYSGVRHQEYHDVHNLADLQHWWQLAYSSHTSAPALPEVDFSKDMVIAVFMGERNQGGYSIAVSNVQATADAYNVEITVTVPGPDCRTTQALTQPFEFVAVPDNHGKFVNWNVQQQYRTCTP